jgi:hypothetical protein|nr:MAG TPA: hypothetical protein [Caudoviricetes sp.]
MLNSSNILPIVKLFESKMELKRPVKIRKYVKKCAKTKNVIPAHSRKPDALILAKNNKYK